MIERTPIIKGEIANYHYSADGILFSYSKSVLRTVDNISANAKLVQSITNNQAVPLLIHLTNSPIPDKATRQLSTELLPKLYTAMAMVSKPGLSSFIMAILFKLKPAPIPMKSFMNEVDALEWLNQFVKQS